MVIQAPKEKLFVYTFIGRGTIRMRKPQIPSQHWWYMMTEMLCTRDHESLHESLFLGPVQFEQKDIAGFRSSQVNMNNN